MKLDLKIPKLIKVVALVFYFGFIPMFVLLTSQEALGVMRGRPVLILNRKRNITYSYDFFIRDLVVGKHLPECFHSLF